MIILNATYMYNEASRQLSTQHFVVVATCVKVLKTDQNYTACTCMLHIQQKLLIQ